MPVAFGAILGGTCTLIGTSTNIAVSGYLARQAGLPPFGLFEMTRVGVILVAAGVVFTIPAILLMGYDLDIGRVTILAIARGLMGVLMMIPLRRALIVKPGTLLGVGLLIALISGIPASILGQPFLQAQWATGPISVGTPMLFDIGVFLVVTGVMLMMIFSLAEES